MLAADSALSGLKLVEGVSAHVSSIPAGSLLLFPPYHVGQGLPRLAPPSSLRPTPPPLEFCDTRKVGMLQMQISPHSKYILEEIFSTNILHYEMINTKSKL
jgi:hypothetical protein